MKSILEMRKQLDELGFENRNISTFHLLLRQIAQRAKASIVEALKQERIAKIQGKLYKIFNSLGIKK